MKRKNQEIKDLYENLQYKDKNIQELKRKAGKERAGNSGSEKEAEKYRKNRSCFQGNKSGIGRKKHTNSGRAAKKVSAGCLGLPCLGKKVPKKCCGENSGI